MKRALFILLCLLGLLSASAHAQIFKDHQAYPRLKQTLTQAQYQEAWQLATRYENEYLGDADFDYLYGLAALHINEPELATFAFERVVANHPHWLDAQFYLANAYVAINNYQSAIDICDDLKSDPRSAEKLKKSAEKLRLSAQKQLDRQDLYISQLANVALGYDSNVNAGAREDDIFIPSLGQTIKLSKDSKENSDNYLSSAYQITGVQRFSQNSALNFTAGGNLYLYQELNNYNRIALDASVDYQYDFDLAGVFLGVKIAPLYLNSDYYRTRYGMNVGVEKRIEKSWLLIAQAYFGQTKNDFNERLSTDDNALEFSAQYFTGKWRHSFNAEYLLEQAQYYENRHLERDTSTLRYSSLWLINAKWLMNAMVSYQHQAYQAPHPFFLDTRADDMWLGGMLLQYQPLEDWSYQLNLSYQEKSSNFDLFSYQRTDISLSANWRF